MMTGSDSEDSGFGDDLVLTSTQAARIGSARPASGKNMQTKGANGVAGGRPQGRCELGALRWSA